MRMYILSQYSDNSQETIMPKEVVFTMKLESDLRENFIAAARASDRPASQVMRELMRDYIRRQNEGQAYDTYVAQKVARGRESIGTGEGINNDDVEKLFAARRARLAGKK